MAATVASRSESHRHDRIFLSVFPKPNFTTPTPEATPQIGAISSPVQTFGGFSFTSNAIYDTVEFNRAWSTATRFLALPPGTDGKLITANSEVLRAIGLVLAPHSTQKDLISWFTNEINVHFRTFVRPTLSAWEQPIPVSKANETLGNTIALLQLAQSHYLRHLEALILSLQHGVLRERAYAFHAQIKQNLHTIILHSLPRQRLQKVLAKVMYQHLCSSLEQSSDPEKCFKGGECHCELHLQALPLKELHDVGLGGLLGERAFAHAVHKFLQGPAIERRCFAVDWNGHSSVVRKLRSWVERILSPALREALAALTGNHSLQLKQTDIQQFVSMAVSNLGRLRTLSLFDYIKSWPASTGAILDIWECLSAGNQNDKAHVCQSFSNEVQRRLLHAEATTSEILSIYVNVIHAFKSLDSRGVLLEKVAVPIRSYLRAREDTVGIIAASFLADIDKVANVSSTDADKICLDITIEVANSTLEDNRDKKMLSWDDMEWMPDPIDAGPDYKSSKSEDAVAHILGLFEQEEFIKEVTAVLAQHLLHGGDSEYGKETRLIELFKSRLDPAKLQAADVMLKDMRDSVSYGKRINSQAVRDSAVLAPATPKEIQAAIPEDGITAPFLYRQFEGRMKKSQFQSALRLVANKRNDLWYPKRTRIPSEASGPVETKREAETTFKAQILSSFFWPQLRSNEFSMPQVLQSYPATYESRFNAMGSQRKLDFRPALARVSLRLDLEDRTVEEVDVSGWRASVIDAFASERSTKGEKPIVEYGQAISLTAEQLVQGLNMEKELVQDALNYWTNKKVLYQPAPGLYAVLERLDMDVGESQQPILQEETISAVKSQNAMLQEGAPMFETFIANMLRNQGPKQIGGMMGITSLLKMVLPTFTYGDDEVAWLLGEMEGRGEVTWNGDVWAVVQ